MLEPDSKLQAFVAVAHQKGFIAGGRSIGKSQPAVSQAVAELERKCGCALFHRAQSSYVGLTPAGERLLPYAEEILHLYEQAARALDDAPRDRPLEMELAQGKSVEVWSVAGEIHLKFKDKD